MTENEEIIGLLRELRDLQKEHFQQYKLFTSSAMERSEKNMAALDQSRIDRVRAIELQEQVLRSNARSRVVISAAAIVQGLLVGAIAFIAVLAYLK